MNEIVFVVFETYFGSPGSPDTTIRAIFRSEDRANEYAVKAKENPNNRFCSYYVEPHDIED